MARLAFPARSGDTPGADARIGRDRAAWPTNDTMARYRAYAAPAAGLTTSRRGGRGRASTGPRAPGREAVAANRGLGPRLQVLRIKPAPPLARCPPQYPQAWASRLPGCRRPGP